MKICIDSDTTGEDMKVFILARLQHHQCTDLNAGDTDQYPDISYRLAHKIAAKEYERGILICGTGIGMAIVANKVKGIYAGTPATIDAAKHMARSNHANVLTIGCKSTTPFSAIALVNAWLETPFEQRINADRMRFLEAQG